MGGNLKYYCRFVAGWVRECMLTWTVVGCTFISMTQLSVGVSCWFITKGYWRAPFFWNVTPRHGVSGSWRSQWASCFHLLGLAPRCSWLVRSCGIWHVTACCTKGLEGTATVFNGPNTCEPRKTKEVPSFETLETAYTMTQRQNGLRGGFLLLFLWSSLDGWKRSAWRWAFYIVFRLDDRNHSKLIRPFIRLSFFYRKRIWNQVKCQLDATR